jgi:hypothetical protein
MDNTHANSVIQPPPHENLIVTFLLLLTQYALLFLQNLVTWTLASSGEILSYFSSFHHFVTRFSKILSNIVIPRVSKTPMWSLTLRFSDINFVCSSYLPHVCYMYFTLHPACYTYPNHISWRVKLFTVHFSPASCYFSFFGPNILLRTLLLNTLEWSRIYSFVCGLVNDTVSSSDYVASSGDDRGLWTGKGVEGVVMT